MRLTSNWRLHGISPINRICEARLRDCLPLLCIAILTFNLLGYFFGFVHYRESSVSQPQRTTPPRVITPYSSSAGLGMTKLRTILYSHRLPLTTAPLPTQFGASTVTWKPPSLPCSVTSRTGRRKDYGRWYNYGISPFQFHAYSAFWDDRDSLLRQPGVIRVIAVSSTRNSGAMRVTDAYNINIEMSCRLYYPDGQSVVVPMEIDAHPIGYGWWLNGEHVREFIFTCSSAPQHPQVPVALEVLLGPPFWSYSPTDPCMPIDFPDKPAVKRDLGACVQVTYGQLNALKLIEWFELQRLLGIEMVGIYNMSIVGTVSTLKVLEHYTQATDNGQEPFVDIRRTDYIEDGPKQFLLHGSPVINDCIYRNMFRFKRIVVVDLDEYIIPQGNDTFDLRQLVTNIESMYAELPKPPPNFIFANNYFFFDSLQASKSSSPTLATSDVNVFLSSEMTVLKHTTRVPISPPGYSVKSVIDPQACLAMQNHYCWAVTPQFSDRTKSAIIDHSLGLNHHYKYCHFEKSECNSLISRTSVNDVMLKYRTQLVARVAAKIRTIFGNSQSDVEQLTF